MPLVKRPSGWFWGSKGPFDSKAKALAVARAAYAHGYKGENQDSTGSPDEPLTVLENEKIVAEQIFPPPDKS